MIKTFRKDELVSDVLEIESLKIQTKEASIVKEGSECGIKLKGYDDYQEGDVIRFYKQIDTKKRFNYTTGVIEV